MASDDFHVDLSLAVNYIPACMILIKATVLMIVWEIIVMKFLSVAWGVFVCMLLIVDRLSTCVQIFDGNSLLFMISLEYVSVCLRNVPHFRLNDVCSVIFSVFWVAFSLYTQSMTGYFSPMRLLTCFSISSVFIGMAPFFTLGVTGEEPIWLRFMRGFMYCFMSIAWSYIVGIYRKRMIKPSDSGLHFVVYFSPVLFLSMHIAIVFCLVAFLLVVVKTMDKKEKVDVLELGKEVLEVIPEESVVVKAISDDEDEELVSQLQFLLKQREKNNN